MPAFDRLVALVFAALSLMGCSDEHGCDQDFYTPEVVRELADMNTPETLLMASMLAEWEFVQEKDPDVALPSPQHLREEALRLAPDDEVVLAYVSAACDPFQDEQTGLACGIEWASKLKDLDPENGFYWANLAHYQLSAGDEDTALASYREAANAPLFSIGWGKQVYRLTRAIEDALPETHSCAAETGVAAAAANLPSFSSFTNACREQSGEKSWRIACMNLGQTMEAQALTVITRMIGFALQKVVYETEGNDQSYAAVEARQAEFREMTSEQGLSVECRWSDPEWREAWLVSLRDYDEMETNRRMSAADPGC